VKEQETSMIKPRIIVTGATGKTGSVVVAELLKAGYTVRALVHREDGRRAVCARLRGLAARTRHRRWHGKFGRDNARSVATSRAKSLEFQ